MSYAFKWVLLLLSINLVISNQCIAAPALSKKIQMQKYSQASQDDFVYLLLYELLNKQDAGYYLEIGAGHPYISNNTCFFEENLGWEGVSIDISAEHRKLWHSSRKNPLLIEDATQSNYLSILSLFPRVLDYLSLDIDSSYDIVLGKIPFDRCVFKIVTIEHDFYRLGDIYRKEERRILESLGYYLLCPDVSVFFSGKDCTFEDWWIHPSAFPSDIFTSLISLDLKSRDNLEIINIIKNHIKQIR